MNDRSTREGKKRDGFLFHYRRGTCILPSTLRLYMHVDRVFLNRKLFFLFRSELGKLLKIYRKVERFRRNFLNDHRRAAAVYKGMVRHRDMY